MVAPRPSARRPRGPILIDTDPGVDDALALLLAWGSPELEVVAVTTVAGNVPEPVAARNLDRLLALATPAPPPAVGRGAAQPLGRALMTAEHYHGADGLGDAGGWPARRVEPREEPAAGAPVPAGVGAAGDRDAAALIVETARRLGPALTLVALGPLTNVAHALRRDRAALAAIGRVVWMGGAVDVPGNVTADAEFNAHVDPEAAMEILAAGLQLEVVPLDATRGATVTPTELAAALAEDPGPVAERVAAITRRAFARDGAAGIALHDPLAVAVALDATLVTWERGSLAVDADGSTRRASHGPACRWATGVDRARFLRLALPRIARGRPR